MISHFNEALQPRKPACNFVRKSLPVGVVYQGRSRYAAWFSVTEREWTSLNETFLEWRQGICGAMGGARQKPRRNENELMSQAPGNADVSGAFVHMGRKGRILYGPESLMRRWPEVPVGLRGICDANQRRAEKRMNVPINLERQRTHT